jgi:hypothetical protein
VVTICAEMAQAMGASHEQILGSIHSAVNTQTSRSWRGDGAVRGCHATGEVPQGDPGHRSSARGQRRQGIGEGHLAAHLRVLGRRAPEAQETGYTGGCTPLDYNPEADMHDMHGFLQEFSTGSSSRRTSMPTSWYTRRDTGLCMIAFTKSAISSPSYLPTKHDLCR